MNSKSVLRFLPALVLAVFGLVVAFVGSGYSAGTLTRMGPGFMPLMLGLCLAALALILGWLERHTLELLPWIPPRPVLCIAGGILAWALLIDVVGFFPAGIVQLVLSALAVPQERWPRVLALILALTAVGYVLFIYFLGVPVPAFGS